MITFAYPWVLVVGFLLLVLWGIILKKRGPVIYYRYSYAHLEIEKPGNFSVVYLLNLIRFFCLISFIFLAARPQLIDKNSKVNVNGVDIILSLDVSGSMELIDDPHDQRTRIEVSKEEAIKFIDRRENDSLGIVVFGADALSLCPLTLDKKLLKDTVSELFIGRVVGAGETFLGAGLATSVNRLRHSKAKSKVIVLLTDGCSSPGDTFNIDSAIDVANIFKVKVYAIGIGGLRQSYQRHPQFGLIPRGNDFQLDMKTLKKIATKTGGLCFEAKRPQDLEKIYKTIDELEKTVYETTLYAKKEEIILPFLLAGILFFLCDFLLRFLWWRLPV
jgi:Ca-activated chloride channel family protein